MPKRNKVILHCDACNNPIGRTPSTTYTHNFCNRDCYKTFYGPIFAEWNRKRNPELARNPECIKKRADKLRNKSNPKPKLPPETREAIANKLRDKGTCTKTYRKYFGRHEHRIIAEQILGRPLEKGEIVHHIDNIKRNNDPNNLQIMTQSIHASLHSRNRKKVM